jgi:NADPH:quinone reductase-like Zn-dependent oxidoreductase
LLGSGGLAEKVVVDKRLLLGLPDDFDFAAAASIPEVWVTAFLNVFMEGQLAQNECLLVHAAASGVGTAAVQLARRHGARVLASSRSAGKFEKILALGAHRVIDTSKGFELDEPVDVILDVLGGGPALMQNLNALSLGGRLVMIAMLQGAKAEIDLRVVLAKRLRLVGSTLRSRPLEEKAKILSRFKTEVWPGFLTGELKPVIDATFPMARVNDAAARLASNETVGKVIVTW